MWRKFCPGEPFDYALAFPRISESVRVQRLRRNIPTQVPIGQPWTHSWPCATLVHRLRQRIPAEADIGGAYEVSNTTLHHTLNIWNFVVSKSRRQEIRLPDNMSKRVENESLDKIQTKISPILLTYQNLRIIWQIEKIPLFHSVSQISG